MCERVSGEKHDETGLRGDQEVGEGHSSVDRGSSMKCWVRACKDNKDGECQRFKKIEDLEEAFKNGGGCAFTWLFSGRIPKSVEC